MKATTIRKGNILLIDKTLYRVLNMDHVTPGKGRAHVQVKLRSIVDGRQSEMRFSSDDDVEQAFLEHRQMQYLYGDQAGHHFMDTESYEQIVLSDEVLGDTVQYIMPEQMVTVQSHDGSPLGLELPPIVELKVVETPPSVKDATASAQRKPATMETGLIVQVPAFIGEGEVLRINTMDGSYSERATKVSR